MLTYSDKDRVWNINDGDYTAPVLVIADGSNSYLGRKLGIIPDTAPEAVCSHSYVQNAEFEADGVMIYSRSVLPSYSALFKHADGDMYIGTYVLPGGDVFFFCLVCLLA